MEIKPEIKKPEDRKSFVREKFNQIDRIMFSGLSIGEIDSIIRILEEKKNNIVVNMAKEPVKDERERKEAKDEKK